MLTSPQTYKLTLAYNGQGYFGFQRQPRKKTIQSELEKAFFKILREKIVIIPSGRTDTGVHALKQVCHFDVRTKKAKARLKKKNFLNGKYFLNLLRGLQWGYIKTGLNLAFVILASLKLPT